MGVPLNNLFLDGILTCKPSILGDPHFRKSPNCTATHLKLDKRTSLPREQGPPAGWMLDMFPVWCCLNLFPRIRWWNCNSSTWKPTFYISPASQISCRKTTSPGPNGALAGDKGCTCDRAWVAAGSIWWIPEASRFVDVFDLKEMAKAAGAEKMMKKVVKNVEDLKTLTLLGQLPQAHSPEMPWTPWSDPELTQPFTSQNRRGLEALLDSYNEELSFVTTSSGNNLLHLLCLGILNLPSLCWQRWNSVRDPTGQRLVVSNCISMSHYMQGSPATIVLWSGCWFVMVLYRSVHMHGHLGVLPLHLFFPKEWMVFPKVPMWFPSRWVRALHQGRATQSGIWSVWTCFPTRCHWMQWTLGFGCALGHCETLNLKDWGASKC